MEPEEAIDLMLKVSLQDLSNEALRVDAGQLVTGLGYLALAINQAASYIAKRACALNEYLDILQKRRKLLMKDLASKQNSRNYPWSVYTTWEISFRSVQEKSLLASQVLQIFSYLHNDQIPKEIFNRASGYISKHGNNRSRYEWISSRLSKPVLELLETRQDGEWDSEKFEEAIDYLQSYSIVKRERDGDEFVYGLHPLVHSWMRDRLAEQDQLPFKRSAVCLLSMSQRTTYGRSDLDLRFTRKLFVHVESCWNLFPEHFTCGTTQEPQVISGVSYLADVYSEVGARQKAEKLRLQVLEASKRVLGAENPDTLTSMGDLAQTYRRQGRFEEAEQLEVQELEARKRTLGTEHPDTLATMNNLASTYRGQGRLEEAEQLEVQLVEVEKRVLGPEHPDTLRSMQNLAITYWRQGRLEKAEELLLQALEARKRVHGAEHPETLKSMDNLASIYLSQGRLEEAEQLGMQALEAKKRVLGAQHPSTLRSMDNYAFELNAIGRVSEAIEIMAEAMGLSFKVLGENHPDTKRRRCDLARWKAENEGR
jgi:tetratricopeptide (TPR) repeat protein